MKHIFITGSTRGIGYGLAEAFLLRGCSVTVSGRSDEVVKKAVAGLSSKYEAKRVFGLACDVTVPEQVRFIWDGSVEQFGRVDIWVNNAGTSGEQGGLVWELLPMESMGSDGRKHAGLTLCGTSKYAIHYFTESRHWRQKTRL